MKPRSRFWSWLAVFLSVGLGLLLIRALFSTHTPAQWLVASTPTFRVSTDARGNHPMICLCVSNASPRDLRFELPWLECRTQSYFIRHNLSPVAGAGATKVRILPQGCVTNVFLELSTDTAPDETCVFCCRIRWIEKESRLDLLTKLADRPMYWLAAVIGFNWNSPWRRRLAYGDLFASNVGVAPYFRRAYGFTFAGWLEDQRLEQQRFEDLARQQSAMPAGTRFGYATSRHGPSTAEDQAANEAKSVFALFCRTSTNAVGNLQSRTPPANGPARPAERSRGAPEGAVR